MFICNVLFCISIFLFVRSWDQPTEESLNKYLQVLRLVSEFYGTHPEQMNIHSLFALSIANVNFQLAIQHYPDIKFAIKNNLIMLLANNQHCIDAYMKYTNKTMSKQFKAISSLFYNIQPLGDHLHEFTYKEHKYSIDPKVKNVVWNKYWYEKGIKDLKSISPGQQLSNYCLASLAEYPINNRTVLSDCPLKRPCMRALIDGTDYGYALAHKVLWLALSRYGRGCTILAAEADVRLTNNLCKKAYNEIIFLISYKFEFGKVMFDLICACALMGQSEFLQNSWLNNSINLQTTSGCFKSSLKVDEFEEYSTSKCDHHTTSVSICALSAAVRFLLQIYKYYPF